MNFVTFDFVANSNNSYQFNFILFLLFNFLFVFSYFVHNLRDFIAFYIIDWKIKVGDKIGNLAKFSNKENFFPPK